RAIARRAWFLLDWSLREDVRAVDTQVDSHEAPKLFVVNATPEVPEQDLGVCIPAAASPEGLDQVPRQIEDVSRLVAPGGKHEEALAFGDVEVVAGVDGDAMDPLVPGPDLHRLAPLPGIEPRDGVHDAGGLVFEASSEIEHVA